MSDQVFGKVYGPCSDGGHTGHWEHRGSKRISGPEGIKEGSLEARFTKLRRVYSGEHRGPRSCTYSFPLVIELGDFCDRSQQLHRVNLITKCQLDISETVTPP